ncbi:hypothetical protein TNIN_197151 [Trichonephila inaurata madagascariensis]|uniref:Uncharacterized protein n=1 Tax=Trichonephila inaurata madagascariensis TaxID=2747483 RepID=A0A8X6XWD2_9ARAC|nr:hypothetical protein TNIN_197151 [Trichonephila inaurata madagascariensis]
MSVSPRCHEAVPVPETTSTPIVEALQQIFRRFFPRDIQADRGALSMNILTTNMLMAELPQVHEQFDLSYLDNVVVFSDGCEFPIDHMDGILERNTHLAVRPV